MPAVMKPFPWKCPTCRQRQVAPCTLPFYSAEMEHDGRKYIVNLSDFAVLKCNHCGAIVLDDQANRHLSEGLRQAAGLLTPTQIRMMRENLGLTQKQLAKTLQVAESTLSRWETGAQIQQRCMDKFLRGFFTVPELRSFLD